MTDGYVVDCLIEPRPDETLSPWQMFDPVRLDGYAIVPRVQYEATLARVQALEREVARLRNDGSGL